MKAKLITLPDELAQRVSDYRFAHKIKSEAEAIRSLLDAGLRAGKHVDASAFKANVIEGLEELLQQIEEVADDK